MNFAIFRFFASLFAYSSDAILPSDSPYSIEDISRLSVYGNVTYRFNREILTKPFFRISPNRRTLLNETFTFPRDWEIPQPMIVIEGIKVHFLAPTKPKITILDGGIGHSFVTINLVASPGQYLNCDFDFFVSRPNVPLVVADFIETEFDIDIDNI